MKFSTTSKDVAQWRKGIMKSLRDDPGYLETLEKNSNIQRKLEESWLKSTNLRLESCKMTGISQETVKLWLSVQEKNKKDREGGGHLSLYSIKGRGIFDADVMTAAACLAHSISTGSHVSSLSSRETFRRYITNLRRIGIKGAPPGSGFLAVADLNTASASIRDLFVIKAPLTNCAIGASDIRHEAVVGIFGTNALRLHIPNFVYIYAIMEGCSPPVSVGRHLSSPRRRRVTTTRLAAESGTKRGVERDDELITNEGGEQLYDSEWCLNKGTNSPYLIMENISGSVTLASQIKRMSVKEFYAILMQLVYALKFAFEKIKFTHYDLHCDNILLRDKNIIHNAEKRNIPIYIPYEEGNVLVEADSIVTIIDYGFSHFVSTNSENREISLGCALEGRADLVQYGIFRDRPNPMTDVYRMLIFSANDASMSENDLLYKFIEKLMVYFNQDETMEDIIKSQKESMYYLPLTTTTRAYTFSDFLIHAKKVAKAFKVEGLNKVVVDKLPKGAILISSGCIEDIKNSITDSIKRLENNLSKSPDVTSYIVTPTSFLLFYDIYSNLVLSLDTEKKISRIKSFTTAYISGFTEKKSGYNKSIKEAEDSIDYHQSVFNDLDTTEYVPLPRDLELLVKYKNKNVAALIDKCLKSISIAAVMFSSYSAIKELYRAFKYTTDLYWKGKPINSLPEEIEDLDTKFNKFFIRNVKPVTTVFKLVASDARITTIRSKGLAKLEASIANADSHPAYSILYSYKELEEAGKQAIDAAVK